jgi:organic hydroperoxide reductase OsmC/OhrA
MDRSHRYAVTIEWTGNDGGGTPDYAAYRRDLAIRGEGKPEIAGSSDAAFRGDPTRYNPEDLLVASLSACHLLWYLHLCATHGISVASYVDHAQGTMVVGPDGGGKFTEVVLRPHVRIASGDLARATELHGRAHELCFIANSVNFPVRHEPVVEVGGPAPARPSPGPAPAPDGIVT